VAPAVQRYRHEAPLAPIRRQTPIRPPSKDFKHGTHLRSTLQPPTAQTMQSEKPHGFVKYTLSPICDAANVSD
jgi:hypothetical protein